jgi:phosphatidylglycerophosphatase A
MKPVARVLAIWFGAGLLRPAPGTWGTVAGLPFAFALHLAGGFAALAMATLAVTLIGWWAIARETAGRDDPDPSEIVIDEVAGIWLALWPVSLGAQIMGVEIWKLWPGWLVAFAAFRAFDILKPGPVGWADRLHTPWGVMLDDLIAGLMAAVVVVVLAALAHGVLM